MIHTFLVSLCFAVLWIAGNGGAPAFAAADAYVKVAPGGTRFEREGRAHRFVGANLWQGAMLGRPDAAGDRPRLRRELDRLQAMGVTNLRVLALWEGPDSEPWRILPTAQPAPGRFSEPALVGLDTLLSELAARGMTAVLVLNNFWPWSGGMSQYLAWAGAGAIPYPPPHPGGDWGRYQRYTAAFYSNARALALAEAALRAVVTRVNTVTGRAYRDDPAILSWQLANEPRGDSNTAAFNRWIRSTAALIRSLDGNHLISTGCEGLTPWPQSAGLDLQENHASPDIAYVTAHVWAQNWGWYDPALPQTYAAAVAKMKAYVGRHLELAKAIRKPLVVEEFGFPRDGAAMDPFMPAGDRARYYGEVFRVITDAAAQGGPAAGVNFWAWAGEGLPTVPGGHWQGGQTLTGDPPHEAQGWYGVYEHDAPVIEQVQEASRRLQALP
ncbi:MAG: hypothetical protein IT285_14570 [Bdellovibrionales bacterium]|nr:hypothetical protein [Bdellovibrionales bacterium]